MDEGGCLKLFGIGAILIGLIAIVGLASVA